MVRNIINSFKYAFSGIITSFKSERNMKIHACAMFAVIIAGLVFKINIYEWFICTILFVIVIAGELFNTAVENIVDMVMPERNELAKKAKDAAAGAVLVLAAGAAVIGFLIFLPKILNLIQQII